MQLIFPTRIISASVCALVLCLFAPTVSAQDAQPEPAQTKPKTQDKDDLVPDELESLAKDRANRGWVPKLQTGISLAFAHSDQVVGAQDGQTWSIGPAVDAGLSYYRSPHEFRNTLLIRHVQTRTPVVNEFVKTVDRLNVATIYLFHTPGLPWLGPYVRADLETSLFSGEAVRGEQKTFSIKELDGSLRSEITDRLALTEPFSPLTLRQAMGLFAKPIDRAPVVLEFRLGGGAREVFVQDGLALKDDDKTSEIEVVRLEDYSQVGVEVFAGISGKIEFEKTGKDRPIVYGFLCESMFPAYSSVEDDRSVLELTNVRIEAKIGIKLLAWVGLDYALRAIREPLTLDAFQIQNNLTLNFAYGVFQ